MAEEENRAELRARIVDDEIDNSWVEAHQQGDPPTDPVGIEWIRSRPESVQALMRRFPPACVVQGTRSLGIPRPGEYAVVQSYTEDGQLSVIRGGDEAVSVRAFCHADWLAVVGYHRGMTRAWVNSVLERR